MMGTSNSNGQALGNKVFSLYYGNWPACSGATCFITIVDTFITNFARSTWFGVISTYLNGYGGAAIPTALVNSGMAKVPYSNTIGGTASSPITVTTVTAAFQALINAGTIIPDENTLYMFTQSKDMYYSDGPGWQFGPSHIDYCGFHWSTVVTLRSSTTQVTIKWMLVPDPTNWTSGCSTVGASSTTPNKNYGADAMISILAHEIGEALSDPMGDAWFDSAGEENADKCSWNFGSNYYSANGGTNNANIAITDALGTTRYYLIQQNWEYTTGTQMCTMAPY